MCVNEKNVCIERLRDGEERDLLCSQYLSFLFSRTKGDLEKKGESEKMYSKVIFQNAGSFSNCHWPRLNEMNGNKSKYESETRTKALNSTLGISSFFRSFYSQWRCWCCNFYFFSALQKFSTDINFFLASSVPLDVMKYRV